VSLPVYLIDTHALYWYMTNNPRLPKRVQDIFDDAEAGRSSLLISHIVLAELFYVLKKHKQADHFLGLVGRMQSSAAYRMEPLAFEDVLELPNFDDVPEMHDRLIAIQAKRLGAVVVTKDKELQDCSQVRWLW